MYELQIAKKNSLYRNVDCWIHSSSLKIQLPTFPLENLKVHTEYDLISEHPYTHAVLDYKKFANKWIYFLFDCRVRFNFDF